MAKYFITFVMFLVCAVVFAQKIEQFSISPTKSTVNWSGKKIVGKATEGTILIQNGFLNFSNKKLVTGEVHMNTRSIASSNAPARLIEHLKNDDFFAVDKYPSATFVITSVSGNLMRGKMTIKGITQEMSLPVDIVYDKDVVHAKALKIKIDRTKYDVKYKSGNIFSGLGDGAIDDNFILDIHIVAERNN